MAALSQENTKSYFPEDRRSKLLFMQNWLSLNHSSQIPWAFPRFSLLPTLPSNTCLWFHRLFPPSLAASELGVSVPQPQAHPLLCLHTQTLHDPWKNVLTGIYQIPMLSVPVSVLTLGFWDSWFPKRPLTVKLNKGWGRHAGQELLLSLHHSFLLFHSQADIPFPVLGTHGRGFSQVSSNILWSVPNFPELSEQALPYPLLCSQPDCFGDTHPLIQEADLTQASHKRVDQGGTKQFLLPVWWLGGMPTAPSTPGAQNVRFQSAPSSGCDEDVGLHFQKLELISIGVLCCQGRLLSLCIVLLCDPTHKLFLSTPQWIAERNKPHFMSVWRAHAQWLHAHHGSHISHPSAVLWKLLSHYTQQQHSPNCS